MTDLVDVEEAVEANVSEDVEVEMDALDVLLGASQRRQVETFKIDKRPGLPADLELQLGSITDTKFEELQTQSEKPVKGGSKGQMEQDTPYFMRLVVANGVVSPNLADERLLAHHGVRTADALIRKLLLPGEITKCAEYVMDLSGYRDDSVTKVKN